jgi:uroporphyrinogen decarboxylase
MTIQRPFKTTYNWDYLEKVLRREVKDGPVPIIELFADPEIMSEVTGIDFPAARAAEIFTRASEALADSEGLELGIRLIDLSIAFSKAVGYDYVTTIPAVPLKKSARAMAVDADERRGRRGWMEEHKGILTTRQDFERYEWPSLDQVSLLPVDYVGGQLPPGMKAMVMVQGIFEDLKEMMGLQEMAIKSVEEPELLDDILERLTILAVHTTDIAAAHPATGAIFYAEDMGGNQGPLLSPKFMRKYFFPRQARIAAACHKHNKPFLIHACGQLMPIMDDLVGTVGIDAKHSFQDGVQPVEETYRKYHDRIAVLGGLDIELMTHGSIEQVRARTRQILDACAPGGGFCMGTGNSVANYLKIDNYYAMLDETREWNEEHGYK